MAKYSVPGINFTEIDNTVRSNSLPGLGIGAIVLKSNKGPVNQRILTSSYDYFTQIYGEPENLDDYGHFAAENYLAISNQLLCVRATMGDEGYAQIQYPYTDADINDKYLSKDTSEFKYINNEDDSQLKLLGPLDTVTTVSALTTSGEWVANDYTSAFALQQRAQYATIKDLITDAPASIAVYKTVCESKPDEEATLDEECIVKDYGQYVEFATKVSQTGEVTKKCDDLIFTDDAWSTGGISPDAFAVNKTPITYTTTAGNETTVIKGYKTQFVVPGDDTLNGEPISLTAYFDEKFADQILSAQNDSTYEGEFTYKDIFNYENFYAGSAISADESYCSAPEAALKIVFRDWDDITNKTHYVLSADFVNSVGQAAGIQFREYGFNTKQEALIALNDEAPTESTEWTDRKDVYVIKLSELFNIDPDKVSELADEYGVDVAEITTDKYSLLKYYDVWNGKPLTEDGNFDTNSYKENLTEKIIYTEDWDLFKGSNVNNKPYNEFLFWTIAEKNATKAQTVATFVQNNPNGVVIPWQDGLQKEGEGEKPINKMVAIASSEVLNSTNDTYRDGYTISIESDDEPGNGDIEQYVSNKNNQLIIASIGPGEYGNDIGVSVITTECADIPALNHQNAFNWKYRYDD